MWKNKVSWKRDINLGCVNEISHDKQLCVNSYVKEQSKLEMRY